MNRMEQRVNERLDKLGLAMERQPGAMSAIVARCAACPEVKLIRGTHGAHLPPEVALKKLGLAGWQRFPDDLWRCRKCASPPPKESDMATAVGPDYKTLRAIMGAIEEHFDTDHGRYRGTASDEAIAKRLGYSPAIVAKVREDAFGPLKPQVPAEVVQLQKDIADLRQLLNDMEDRVAKVVQGYHSRAAA